MGKHEEKYHIGGTNFFNIRNRNEVRVLEMMKQVMTEPPIYDPDPTDLQDIYALALNSLPPRYAQQGTIVLREPVKNDEILSVVREAFAKVIQNPKD